MIRIEGNRTALYQWDSNQRIILNDIFAGTQVHFTDEHSAESECLVVMSYQENGQIFANVPNILLQNSGTINVYIYVEKEDKAYTEYFSEILVLPRKKPQNYVYTETDVLSVTNAVNKALKEAKENGDFKGDPGSIGPTPKFSIGNVNTVESTEPASATITGTPENPVLNLNIPRGRIDAQFDLDKTLTLKNGTLSVNTTDDIEEDNSLPITSSAVYTTVGNIEILLKTI